MKRIACDAFPAPTKHDEANQWHFELAGQTREIALFQLAHKENWRRWKMVFWIPPKRLKTPRVV